MKEYKRSNQEQRYQIQASRKAQMSMRAISRTMGVSPSTISRELKRNTGQRGYRPKQAHQKAQERHEQKRKVVHLTEELKTFIFNQLTHYDSSHEQISGRMKRELG